MRLFFKCFYCNSLKISTFAPPISLTITNHLLTMLQELTIRFSKTKQSRLSEVDFNNLPFGKIFSDHMALVEYSNGEWQTPQILPYGPIPLSPATSALHYGQAIFEGMKANVDQSTGEILVFRPEKNAARFNRSATRMCMPTVPEDLFLETLYELLRLDKAWIPQQANSALYIRPYMFASDEFVGVRPSDSYKFIIFTCPVGAYYTQPVNVLVAEKYSRAATGGTGEAKAAGNYGAAMYPSMLAKKQGYDQMLWMDSRMHRFIDEIGTMNVFFVIGNTVVTPALDGTILDGVTRSSVVQLCKDRGLTVEERQVSIDEILDANDKGVLTDAFGAGTAATITYIVGIGYKGQHHNLMPVEKRTLSVELKAELDSIKRGIIPDKHNWIVRL